MPRNKKNAEQAQSAMEYLMTYGWAILIIAVVLAVLYQLGVFSSTSTGVNVCIPTPGFACSPPFLAGNGLLSMSIGQVSAEAITITGINCTSSSAPPIFNGQSLSVTLQSGSNSSFAATCPISNLGVGQSFTGHVWIQYNTATQTGLQESIGTIEALLRTPSVETTVPIEYSGTTTTIIFSTNAVTYAGQGGPNGPDSPPHNYVYNYISHDPDNYYICTAGAYPEHGNVVAGWSFTPDVEDPGPYTAIGHQTYPDVPAPYQCYIADPDELYAGGTVGMLGVYQYSGTPTIFTSAQSTGDYRTLSYTVSSANSFVALLAAAGEEEAIDSANTLPSGCSEEQYVDGLSHSYSGSIYIAACQSQPVGSYSFTILVPFSGGPTSQAAYVFPPQYISPPSGQQFSTASGEYGDYNDYAITYNFQGTPGYSEYICVASNSDENAYPAGITSPSYTVDAQDANALSSIGHQSSSTCSFTGYSILSAASIGLYGAPAYTETSAVDNGVTGSATVSYTISSSDSFVVIAASCGANGCTSVSLPAGCTQRQFQTTIDGDASTYIATCQSQADNTYTSTVTASYTGGGESIAAYVFPNYDPTGS